MKKIRDQSGFGWNDAQKIPTAPDDVWMHFLEVGPSSVSQFQL